MKQMAKLALAIGLGVTLISGASSPSMARSSANSHHYHPGDNNGSAWSYNPDYENSARGAYARAPSAREDRSPEWNGGGTHYYEGDDNGTVWSYYQGYRPLR